MAGHRPQRQPLDDQPQPGHDGDGQRDGRPEGQVEDLLAVLVGPGEPPRQERAQHDQLAVGEVEHLRRAVDEDDAQGDDGDDAAIKDAGDELLGDELPVHVNDGSKGLH